MLRFSHKFHCHSNLTPFPLAFYRSFSSSSVNNISNRTTTPSERNWDPTKIFPNEPGQVRICGITMRDGHQSLNGGLHRIDLLEKASILFDKIRPPSMLYPGCEEIGGGTTVDFPLRFKGENPFRNMEIISKHLPNTPTSVLIRSDSLCGYNINPRSIVDAFITRYAECGIDIFRVFDAYNNPENQATVAKAVLDNGKHYQAAITFTSHSDETLFNDGWVAYMAESFAKLGAHSICIKDMAGIASPYLMSKWVKAIKLAVPHLPVHIHSHYTTGFSPITYLEAIKAGASCIDCGISTLSGRSGHPAMEVFNQALYDMDYDIGWDYKNALESMKEIANLYREYHERYEFCEMKMAGSVDYRVFTQGIPGGQISIMRNELVRNGYGHLFDKVIDQIQRVRSQVGGVALVTPTSEHVARQSIVNAMNGQDETNDDCPLWPGYSEMLRGVMGRPPSKPDVNLQKRALREWVLDNIKKELIHIHDDNDILQIIKDNVNNLVEFMWNYSKTVRNLRDAEDLKHRINQLTKVDSKLYSKQIAESQKEFDELSKNIASKDEDNKYTLILKCEPDNDTYNKLLNGSVDIGKLVTDNKITKNDFLDIIKSSTLCTVCPSSIISDDIEKYKLEVEKLAVDKEFECDLPQRGTIEFEEHAILQCMFKHAQNIAQFWFQHNENNPQFWDKNFPNEFPFDRLDDDNPIINNNPIMYPFKTKVNNNNNQKEIIEWSNTELNRIFNRDILMLNNYKNKLNIVKKWNEENDYRKILKKRSCDKYIKLINNLENSIKSRIKTSIYNIQSHEAGYKVDVNKSIDINWNKCLLLK